jgi:predicted deacylase
LNAVTSGMFVPTLEHGVAVTINQLLGHIVSPFQGDSLAVVRSPVAGRLFTLRRYPLVYEGSLLARIVETPTLEQGS